MEGTGRRVGWVEGGGIMSTCLRFLPYSCQDRNPQHLGTFQLETFRVCLHEGLCERLLTVYLLLALLIQIGRSRRRARRHLQG